jgi:osmotically-inducible protein OsmY
MKKNLGLILLSSFSSVSLFSANYNANYSNGNSNPSYYQTQPDYNQQRNYSGQGNYQQGNYNQQGNAGYQGQQPSNQRFNAPANQQGARGQGYNNYGPSQGNYEGRQYQTYNTQQGWESSQGYENPQGQWSYNNQYNQQQNQNSYESQDQQENDETADNYESNQGNAPAVQKNPADEAIQKKVHSALSSWFSNAYKDVTYDVNNGTVILRGTVSSIEEKKKAEDAVRKIEGVRQVVSQIIVTQAKTAMNEQNSEESSKEQQENQKKYPYDYAATPGDRQLNIKIRDKLKGGWFSKGFESVIIRTTNGFVIITGTVDRADDIKKINELLKDIEGVRSINNQAQVAPKNG